MTDYAGLVEDARRASHGVPARTVPELSLYGRLATAIEELQWERDEALARAEKRNCARDQRTTQFCAIAVAAEAQLARQQPAVLFVEALAIGDPLALADVRGHALAALSALDPGSETVPDRFHGYHNFGGDSHD